MNASASTSNEANNLTVLTDATQNDVSDRQQETAFNDAAAVMNDESTGSTSQLERFNELQSIIAFLERPTVIWQSRIDSTAIPLVPVNSTDPRTLFQTPLKTFTFPSDLMNVGGKMDKIANFEWFKTDIKLRILINANPFIAGRLYITYAPLDADIYEFARIDRKGRAGVTSYPGVEIDLQTNTAAELIVPWINEADAQKAQPDNQKLFRVDIWALTPLLVADNALKIPITVFGSFTNISLKFPTPTPPFLGYIPTGVSQMSRKKEAKGPLEEVASGIGNIAGRLTNLPVVGTIASSAKWASDMVGGVASIFGWSRPIEGSHAEAFAHIPGRGMGQFKSKDSGTVLGMSNDNEIAEETNNFVSTVDEMSIEHICSRPGLIEVVDWSVTQDFNTMLGAYNANRETSYNTYDGVNNNVFTTGAGPTLKKYQSVDSTLAEYTLANFHMYRADWHFRISLVKTAFHVGRLEFVFVPNHSPISFPSTQDTTNGYRQIFDITEQNEFEFVVPYNHQFVMLSRDYTNPLANPTVGTLYIRVNSPLTCPDTVSQSIKILVWKYATNVAVAYPTLDGSIPTKSVTYGIPTGVSQINVTNESKNVKYVVFNDENDMNDSLKATKVVAGENCVSLREATRSFRLYTSVTGAALENSWNIGNLLTYRYNGYIGMCSNIFYFYRGGLSYKVISHKPQPLYSYLSVFPEARIISGSQDEFQSCPFHFTPENNPVHEISVPFYSETRRRVCNDIRGVSVAGYFDQRIPFVALKKPDETKLEHFDIFVAGKDDLTFGFLIGPPLLNIRFNPSK